MRLQFTRGSFVLPLAGVLVLLAGCATAPRIEKDGGVSTEEAETRERTTQERQAIESAEERLADGDAAGALAVYEEAFGRTPVGTDDAVLYAGLLREAGQKSEAREVLEALLASGARDAEAMYGLALLEQSGGSREQYRGLLEQALESDPSHGPSLAGLGELKLEDGEIEEGRSLLERALTRDPENVVALTRLGGLALDAEDLDSAEMYFDRIVAAAPEFAFAYFDRAKVKRRRSDYDGALEDLDRALALDPGYYWGFIDRGRLHMLFGRLQEATADFRAAETLEPENFVSYVYSSGALYQLEQWEEAALAFERVIELEPGYSFAYTPLAEIRYRQEDWEAAAAAFIRGFEQSPREAHLPLVAALAIKWSGEEKLARDFLRDNLSRLPADGWIRATADFLIRPEYDLSMMNAIKEEGNPINKKRMLFYLGVQYLMMGRPHAATVYLLEAAELERDDLLEKRLASWELERHGIDE